MADDEIAVAVEAPDDSSLRDIVSLAMDKFEEDNSSEDTTPKEEVVEEIVVEAEPVESLPDRDEKGRFKPAETEESVIEEPEVPVVEVEAQVEEVAPIDNNDTFEARPLPASWQPDFQDVWDKADPRMRAQIEKREQDIFDGLRDSHEKAAKFDQYNQAVSPYMARINSLGMNVPQAIEKLLNTDYTLSTTIDPIAKQHLFVKLAQNYGVNLDNLPIEEDNAMTRLSQQYANQEQKIAMLEQAAQQTGFDPYINEVERFRSNPAHPHFNELESVMTALITGGSATGLDDAYKLALQTRPDYIAAQVSAQKQQAVEIERERVKKVKAAASSVKGSPAQRKAPVTPNNNLRGLLESAFDQIG